MRDLSIAYGNSCMAKTWSNKTTSFAALCERLKTPVCTTETAAEYKKMKRADKEKAKDKGGVIGGQLKGGRRKKDVVISRSMLTLDLDAADTDFIDRYEMLAEFATAIYTTHGHTPEAPRCRLILPLTRDILPEEYVAITRYYADKWGIDQFDKCSYLSHQLMYWPTAPADGDYVFVEVEGDWLDPDAFLAEHPNWRDLSLLPIAKNESAIKESAKKAEDPTEKDGITGTQTTHREEFNRMIEDARKGKIDIILAKSISRFARNTVDTLQFTRELKSLGVGVYFEKERVDSANVTKEFLLTIFAAFAQEESHSISENTKRGIRNGFRVGHARYSRMFGYDSGWEINEEQAEIVKKIFEMSLDGASSNDIATALNKAGVAKPYGSGEWDGPNIAKLLQNEKYCGDALMQKYYCEDFLEHTNVSNSNVNVEMYYKEDHHQGIVTKETYNLAKLSNAFKPTRYSVSKTPYYGMLTCPTCGKPMVKIVIPSIQFETLKYIVAAANIDNNEVIITTHSPYMLTSANMMLYAGANKIYAQSVVEEQCMIDPQDFNCFYLDEHSCESIYENGEIDANVIDSISDKIFDKINTIMDKKLAEEGQEDAM